MGPLPDLTFWGDHWQAISSEQANILGIEENVVFHGEAQEMLISHLAKYGDPRATADKVHNSARIIMQQHKAPNLREQLPKPIHINDDAPDDYNGFTDGGMQNPHAQEWSLGGAGIWWPKTIGPNNPSELMNVKPDQLREPMQFVQSDIDHHGIHLWMAIAGVHCSSTRTELAAGVISLLAQKPINIASDSQAFVDQANRLIYACAYGEFVGLPLNWLPIGPWALVHDGDLWQLFWEFLRIRGARSTKFGKVKGHATNKMVEEGIVRRYDQVHNSIVDGDATRGIEAHGQGVKDMARWFADRHRKYAMFMHQIRMMMIACHRADKNARDQLKKDSDIKGPCLVKIPRRLEYYPGDDGQHIVFKMNPELGLNVEHPGSLDNIRDFFRRYKFGPAPQNHPGISWIELLILYDDGGGLLYAMLDWERVTNPAFPKVTLFCFLNHFRTVVKYLFDVDVADHQRKWVAAGQPNKLRLKHAGVRH